MIRLIRSARCHAMASRALALALVTAASTAIAQVPAPQAVPAQRLEAAALRLDVRTLCPEIDDELPDALFEAWHKVETPGTVDVQFKLEGSRITDVTPLRGPQGYYRHIRRAVEGLQCNGGADRTQLVQFRIHFIDAAERTLPPRTAQLVSPVTVAP